MYNRSKAVKPKGRGRRNFLKSMTAAGAISTAGCLDVPGLRSSTEGPVESPSPTATTVPTDPGYQTRTFHPTPSDHPGQLVLSGGGGPIQVEVFSDYALEACQQFWNHTLYGLRDYYTSNFDTGEGPAISLILRHFPKPVNKWSMFLPCAMMEVRVQTDTLIQKEFHERLFENHFPDYTIRDVEVAAAVVGADPDEVVKAGRERRRSYAIKWHLDRGREYGIDEPLAVVVDGRVVPENTADAIGHAIDLAK